MNRHGGFHELDDPSDEEVEILHEICKAASASTNPPFAALFASYEDFFGARGLDTARDANIFRWLMRVAERVRPERRNGVPLEFVAHLKSLLEERGILIVDHGQNIDINGVTRSFEGPDRAPSAHSLPVRRRVSFDDARLEETWLSEHSRSINPLPQPSKHEPGHNLPYRVRSEVSAQLPLARPNSSQHGAYNRPQGFGREQQTLASSAYEYNPQDFSNPTLLFQPSQTQLEQNAEAFSATSELRVARQCLHLWHSQALIMRGRRLEANEIAISHDRRILLKQSLDILDAAFQQRRTEHEREARLKAILKNCLRRKDRWLLAKAFSHWDESAQHQKRVTAVAQRHAMKVKYFGRWRQIAVDNATKARSLLLRKHFAQWRDHTAQREIAGERALARREEVLMKFCFQRLFWTFCSRRVEGWHEQQIGRRMLSGWRARLQSINAQERQAQTLHDRNVVRRGMMTLVGKFREQRGWNTRAQEHHDQQLASSCLRSISLDAKLAPLEQAVSAMTRTNLMRKAIQVWHLHLSLSQEAAAVDRKRILQSAWTSWNDALRCKALVQRIDERVLVESLYKWVLQERLRSFQKAMDSRILRRGLSVWVSRCGEQSSSLDDAWVVYTEHARHRRLRSAMHSLYSAFRAREDATRNAVEFANARSLPRAFYAWNQKTTHTQKLARWADDARFYCLASHALHTWRDRSSEHKHNRRREAYARVRARVKLRIAKDCFSQWRSKAVSVQALQDIASDRQQTRLIQVGVRGFDTWREQAALYSQMQQQAADADRQKLLTSAFSSLVSNHVDLSALREEAAGFRQDADLALASAAFRRVQWATFTASRHAESAEALWARNRDQHIKHMLRHLVSQAAKRRAARTPAGQHEPESPSLRPASRLAARAEVRSPLDETAIAPATPAYMRTPARSRRTGRFRPLPTPAAVTPMGFDASFYATTPAPLASVVQVDNAGESGSVFEGLTPQITPFARKLKAGGVTPAVPPSALRSSVFGTAGTGRPAGGTNKSVRFARSSRFSGAQPG